jgi:hypothetical protein
MTREDPSIPLSKSLSPVDVSGNAPDPVRDPMLLCHAPVPQVLKCAEVTYRCDVS